MASKILSAKAVDTAVLEPGKLEKLILDGEGLYLRLRRSSTGQVKKSWIFVYTSPTGRRRKLSLGLVKDHSLKEARAWASKQRALVDKGQDPIQAGLDQKDDAAQRQAKTFGALLGAYVDQLERRGKQSARDASGILRLHVPDRLKKLPASEVQKDDLVKAIRKVAEANKGRTAGKLRSYLHAAFESALGAEDDPTASSELLGFGLAYNPVSRIKTMAEFNRASDRHLTGDELREYVNQINSLPEGDTRDLLRLSLYLGGQRVSQILRSSISKGADNSPLIIMQDSKGKRRLARTHILPLQGKALALIEDRDNKLFGLTSQEDVKRELERASGVVGSIAKRMVKHGVSESGFRLGDIRRTVETHLASLGVSSDLRAQIQSHGLGGVQAKHYDRYDYLKEKRRELKKWEAYIFDLPVSNVSKLRFEAS